MRLAIISDTHFGDPLSQLAALAVTKADKQSTLGPCYDAFREAAGQDNDLLILLGDIFDFSMASYAEALAVGKAFFRQIQQDKIARQILYIPGNHDFDIWHFYEYDVNIVRRINNGRPPRPFRFSVPAIINARKERSGEFLHLLGINRDPSLPTGYGGMFIDKLTRNEDGSGFDTPFVLAYPNAYLVTDEFSVLLTHGHYLDSYWSLASEWAPQIAGGDLPDRDALDLADLVALNFPLGQLACSGVGQSGLLSKAIQTLVQEVQHGRLGRVERYLDNLDNTIDRLTPARSIIDPEEAIRDAASAYGKHWLLRKLRELPVSRYNAEFLGDKGTLERLARFYQASLREIVKINQQLALNIPTPQYIILGHTHQPTSWGDNNAPRLQLGAGQPVTVYNTGGWLSQAHADTGESTFTGAAVFTFDSNSATPFRTHIVR